MMKYAYTLIYVDNVKAAMNFYHKAFNLEQGFLHDSLEYGEMITGHTKIGFVHHNTARANGIDYTAFDKKQNIMGIEIGFSCDDVESAYLQAIQAGAIAVSAPMTKPWGQTVSYVRDLNGVLIEICSEING